MEDEMNNATATAKELIEGAAEEIGIKLDWTGFDLVETIQGGGFEILGLAVNQAGLERWSLIGQAVLNHAVRTYGRRAGYMVDMIEAPMSSGGRCRLWFA
jgi:hypothetical protein